MPDDTNQVPTTPETNEINEPPFTPPVIDETPLPEPPAEREVQPAEPDLAPPVMPTPTNHHHHKRWAIIIIVIALLLAGGGVAAWKLLLHPSKQPVAVKQATKPAAIVKPATTTKTTFLTDPIKLADLHFFKDLTYFGSDCTGTNVTPNADYSNCPATTKESDVQYYQIGTLAGGQPILAVMADYTGEGGFDYLALKTDSSHYSILGLQNTSLYSWITGSNSYGTAQQNKDNIASFKKALSDTVSLDTTTKVPELNFPQTVSVAGMSLKEDAYGDTSAPYGYPLAQGLASITSGYTSAGQTPVAKKIGTSGNKTFYEVTLQSQNNYQLKSIYATINNVFADHYVVDDSLSSDSNDALSATWTVGSQTAGSYTSRGPGCGLSGYVVAKGIGGTLLQIGSAGDQALYQLPTGSALFKEIYASDYNNGSALNTASLQNLTPDQFQDQHGVFLAKNALGEYVVYMNNDLIITGGCGKPVIYLYPQTTTSVNVQVGAQVTKSVPTYQSDGWQNVVAQPNGQLSYQGKSYDSLFWEGLGHGVYPPVTSGSVVPRAKVVATIRSQLQQQGLNGKEITDFLAYWQPKLPTSPYTRLTWFNTQQMNQLAPLNITPRPTTTIRVFLDFQGLQTPVNLPAQHLTAPKRNGFTLVEWGGLLREAQ